MMIEKRETEARRGVCFNRCQGLNEIEASPSCKSHERSTIHIIKFECRAEQVLRPCSATPYQDQLTH
jgi:hypothetical protein